MVKGLPKFEEYFSKYSDNYILIGGAACDIHIEDAGLTFRATKDLDIVLIVEALTPELVRNFGSLLRKETMVVNRNRKVKKNIIVLPFLRKRISHINWNYFRVILTLI